MDAEIAIVGIGASATLLVAALRRSRDPSPLRVVLLGSRQPPGRGVAYSTTATEHRMNVPTRRLSVDPDDPDDLVRWLDARGAADRGSETYIPRHVYGDYLAEVLGGGRADEDARSRVASDVRSGLVTSVEPSGTGWVVRTADGANVRARSVVLAVGSPSVPGTFGLPEDERVLRDPWVPGALDRLEGLRRVLVLGTGLTMVDVALSLGARGTEVCAASRHGWLPQAHPAERVPPATPLDVPPGTLAAATVRRLVVEQARREPNGWQAAMDGTRDRANEIWAALPPREQAKLLRRGLSAWSVHRHRMAPDVAQRLDAMVATGQLQVHRGTATAIRVDALGVELELRRGAHSHVLRGDAFVLCTGPAPDVGRTDDPLLRGLLDAGTATLGPHRLGIAVDHRGALIDRNGEAHESLFAIGPLRRGSTFETNAIPELRAQALALTPILLAHAAAGRHVLR